MEYCADDLVTDQIARPEHEQSKGYDPPGKENRNPDLKIGEKGNAAFELRTVETHEVP
jgi:hypothetical protein